MLDVEERKIMLELDMKPAGILRIVFKEIVSGDRRKFNAASNDSPSGGGARDLRFRPYDKFAPVFERMFSIKDTNGILRGHLNWIKDGEELSGIAIFHPPTNSRPNEGRLGRVHEYLPTESLPNEEDGNTILLLIQDDEEKVWPSFTTDRSLDEDDWHVKVKELILNCLHAQRRSGSSMMGYIDFKTGESYCNGG